MDCFCHVEKGGKEGGGSLRHAREKCIVRRML